MYKKLLAITLLLFTLMGMASAQAQDGDRMANPIRRDYHPISSVEIVAEGDQFFLVVKGDLPDGCDFPAIINTERGGAGWFVDIYRELPFDVMCPMVLVSYEEKIDATALFTLDENSTLPTVIILNGKIFGVERASIEPVEGATTPPPMLSELWVRGNLPYDTITIQHTTEGDMRLVLAGILTDGCAMPVYRAMMDWQNPGFMTVDAFVTINIAAGCAQVLNPFEAEMRAPVFESIAINGVGVPFNPAMSVDTQVFNEETVPITSASAEWVEGFAQNIRITVSAVVNGCPQPIQIVPQPPVDNTYMVKVVRVLPAGIACTMIARDVTEEIMFAPVIQGDAPVMLIIDDQMITP
ncbi:MAG: hypothetical protein SH821_11745 [Phototrophicales bacterium]|nr:hypothetical protein [Phototrophicales bacterium]